MTSIKNIINDLENSDIDYKFIGNPDVIITNIKSLESLDSNSIAFCRTNILIDYKEKFKPNNVVIINFTVKDEELPHGNYIKVENPDLAFCIIAKRFLDKKGYFKHPTVIITGNNEISENVYIGAYSCIENSVIDNDVTIEENCVIKNSFIKKGTHIFPGVSLGSSGLGSKKDRFGQYHDFPHFSRVIIENNVVIQDGTVINRGTLNDTIVGKNSRIGPMVKIGHGTIIGQSCFISQGATIAGSVKIGNHCKIWGNVSIRDTIRIGNNAVIGMGAVVVKNIPEGETWVGNPAKRITKTT